MHNQIGGTSVYKASLQQGLTWNFSEWWSVDCTERGTVDCSERGSVDCTERGPVDCTEWGQWTALSGVSGL
ncbi:hypothetical protein CesoFtcFv8_016668 [Champsocephalus esox]|uniref:SRCR domain-containing protein n=1 Tax=Champsocephalus esox TaxID=159716 RepID=A0AAN8GQI6_9TELE|nr:hypothetical protein CesoFtcFv8_016668 [Champsocephalus esox]